MMSKRYTHDEFKKELLKNKSVKRAYDDLEDEFQLKRELIRARSAASFSQQKVADAMNTTKSSISRLETLHPAGRPSPSVETLQKYAAAVGCKIVIKLIPKKQSDSK